MQYNSKITGFICGRDQSLTLEVALRSLEGCDDIFYLDGGSSDDSTKIAKACKAKVIKPPPGFSGSDYRNLAADRSKNPWMIWLSPDEELEADGIDKIKDAMAPGIPGLSVTIKETKFEHSHVFPRIFRSNLKWVGRAHEYLDAPPPNGCDVTIYHHRGPWHENPSDPRGVEKALLLDVADMPENPRWPYYLAREYYEHGKWAKAVEWFQKRIPMGGYLAELADAYLLQARCLWNLSRGDEARESCSSALVINPEFKEAALFMAEIVWPKHKAQWLRMAAMATNEDCLFVRV